MKDEADQARYVVESILACREGGTALKQQAVLFRTSSHSAELEIELTRRNIPFVKFGGLKFLDAAHIKDMLALLRFVENPRDRVAGFRVLQLLPGIGPGTAGKVLDAMADSAESAADAARRHPPPPRGSEGWPGLLEVVGNLGARTAGWPAELQRARLWYEPLMDAVYDDAEVRKEDLYQLEQIASGYPSRERFLTELTLDPPDATSDQAGVPLLDEDYLILSTIHSAKGQEWKNVHVLNVVDGAIPSDLGTGSTHELEEERRLLYVAMTRAKDELHLMVPQRFYVHQQTPVWRQARLCAAQPLHHQGHAAAVRRHVLAAGEARRDCSAAHAPARRRIDIGAQLRRHVAEVKKPRRDRAQRDRARRIWLQGAAARRPRAVRRRTGGDAGGGRASGLRADRHHQRHRARPPPHPLLAHSRPIGAAT